MNKIMNFITNETGTFCAIVLSVIILIWLWGCPSTARSLSNPAIRITREEMKLELDTYLATAEVRFAQLDQQDRFKHALLENAVLIAQNTHVNPMGVILTLAGIMGVGATVDNIGKRRTIRNNAGKTEPPGLAASNSKNPSE